MALELVSYADLKNLLDLEDAEITDYPALNVINDTMIPAFEEHLGRKLNSESRTEVVWTNNSKKTMLMLPAIPITTMTSVTVSILGEDESLTENTHYYVTEYGIKLFTSVKNAKITIVYVGGISAVAEELNLNRAALYQISYEWQNKEWIGSESVTTEGGSVQRPELQLLKETKRMLQPSIHPLHTGYKT